MLEGKSPCSKQGPMTKVLLSRGLAGPRGDGITRRGRTRLGQDVGLPADCAALPGSYTREGIFILRSVG